MKESGMESLAKLILPKEIISNFEVTNIEKVESKWIINDKYEYDLVINTMPLNILPFVIKVHQMKL